MPKDRPDAIVWKDGRQGHFLCALCIDSGVREGGDGIGAAYRAAMAHLWQSHSLKRVWIDEDRPEVKAGAQLAFALAVPHSTQFDRRW